MTLSSFTSVQAPALKPDKKADTRFYVHSSWSSAFNNSGLDSFDDIWNLPENYVEDINYRRGGWSAVSLLRIETSQGCKVFYVKRQENQLRHSLRYPLGRLTYHFELMAIQRNQILNLPGVEVVGFGTRKTGNRRQAMLISRELKSTSLANLITANSSKRNLIPALEVAGKKLYEMHINRISHGALYPNHLYIDLSNYAINLIDFERSRICLTPQAAMKRDLSQFLKRAAGLLDDELSSFLVHYRRNHPELINQLIERFHVC